MNTTFALTPVPPMDAPVRGRTILSMSGVTVVSLGLWAAILAPFIG